MKFRGKTIGLVAASAVLAVGVGVGGAEAARIITSEDIKDGTIRKADLNEAVNDALDKKGKQGETGEQGPAGESGTAGAEGTRGAQGPAGPAGPAGSNGSNGPDGEDGEDGADGEDGEDGLAGAVYRVANYENGGAGDATVACADTEAESMQYTAIAGGVQAGGLQSYGQTSEFDVAASFPGRMDWNTGAPKADRLDGWIVLGSGGWSDTLKVWALCVPNTSIPVEVTNIDN